MDDMHHTDMEDIHHGPPYVIPPLIKQHFTGYSPDSIQYKRINEMTPQQSTTFFANTDKGQNTNDPFSFLTTRDEEGKVVYKTLVEEDLSNNRKIVLPRFRVYDPETGESKKFPTVFVSRKVLEKINFRNYDLTEAQQLGRELLVSDIIPSEGGGAAEYRTPFLPLYDAFDTALLVIILINSCFRDSKIIGRVATDVYLKSVCKFYNAFSYIGVSVAQACVFGLYVLRNIAECIRSKNDIPLIADELIFNQHSVFLEVTDFNDETQKREKLTGIMKMINETKEMLFSVM